MILIPQWQGTATLSSPLSTFPFTSFHFFSLLFFDIAAPQMCQLFKAADEEAPMGVLGIRFCLPFPSKTVLFNAIQLECPLSLSLRQPKVNKRLFVHVWYK